MRYSESGQIGLPQYAQVMSVPRCVGSEVCVMEKSLQKLCKVTFPFIPLEQVFYDFDFHLWVFFRVDVKDEAGCLILLASSCTQDFHLYLLRTYWVLLSSDVWGFEFLCLKIHRLWEDNPAWQTPEKSPPDCARRCSLPIGHSVWCPFLLLLQTSA